MNAPSLRARVRAELTEEILAVARRHLATDGANLSLRAVARDTGMVPSALYRYFPSRDALLTTLITDAYGALASAALAAEAAVPRERLRDRWLALCHAVRGWAVEHPAEYALIYGSPVPGYAAPEETTDPAAHVIHTLVRILFDAAAAEEPAPGRPLPEPVRADLERLLGQETDALPGSPPEAVLAVGFTLWTQLFGLINFEVFGRMNGLIEARQEYFDHQIHVMADLAGLP